MDIRSGCGYPGAQLSNFAPHPFVFEDVKCASMEGLLQAFKFRQVHIQVEVCKLVGIEAKRKGRAKKWWKTQLLYWAGEEYFRGGVDYQLLLDRAYLSLWNQNEKFRKALEATGDSTIQHSLGKTNKSETVLTRREFCDRLTWLRGLKWLITRDVKMKDLTSSPIIR